MALLVGGVLLLLAVTSTEGRAGNGTVVPGTPARVNLSVLFTYDEGNPESWRSLFEAASKLLYQSTQQQMQLGTITVYVNTPQVRSTADIIINNDYEGGRAYVLGLGQLDRPATFSQTHASTSGDALGQLGFVHEMGHYMFGLYDEYLGAQRQRVASSRYPLIPSPGKNYFCVVPRYGGTTCIMDAGTTTSSRFRTFFCDATNHVPGYVRDELADLDGLQTVYVTKQQLYRAKSCWDYMVTLCQERYQVSMTSPDGRPSVSTAGLQPLTYVVADASPRLVLCLDRTVGSTRLSEVKAAASSLLDGLRLGGKVAVVSFGAASHLDVPLTQVNGDADRQAVRQVIDALPVEASATAVMGDGIRAGLDLLVAATPRSGDETVVLVRGETPVAGTSPAQVATDMKARQVRLNYVGVGPRVDLTTLASLARTTGGEGSAATTGSEIAEAMEDLARETQGDYPIMGATHPIAAGGTQGGTVPIDTLARDVSFHVGWDQGDFDLALFDPTGGAVDFGAANVEYHKSTCGVAVRVTGAVAGTWRYQVTSLGVADTVDFQAYSSDSVTGIGVDDSGTEIAHPRPFRIVASANCPSGPLTGAQVTAEVRRPDGTTIPLTLHDDGCQGHGDPSASDGQYSNWFGAYNQDGIYTVEIQVVNRDGRAAYADDYETPPPSTPVPPFQRQESFSFEVSGVPTPVPTGTLTITPSTVPVGSSPVLGGATDEALLSFHLAAGPQEAVLLRELPVDPQFAGNASRATRARLYLDPTGTGQIDDASPTQEVSIQGSTIVFSEAIMVPAGGAVDVLLTMDVNSLDGGVVAAGWAHWAALPVALLLLLPAFSRPRRRTVTVVALVMLVAWVFMPLVGCGSSGSGGSGTGGTPVASSASLQVSARVSPARVVAVGATSGQVIPVTGQAVTGPTVVFQ